MCRHLRSWSFRVDSEALRLPHQVEPPEVQMFRQYLQRPGELKIHRDCQAIAEPAPWRCRSSSSWCSGGCEVLPVVQQSLVQLAGEQRDAVHPGVMAIARVASMLPPSTASTTQGWAGRSRSEVGSVGVPDAPAWWVGPHAPADVPDSPIQTALPRDSRPCESPAAEAGPRRPRCATPPSSRPRSDAPGLLRPAGRGPGSLPHPLVAPRLGGS